MGRSYRSIFIGGMVFLGCMAGASRAMADDPSQAASSAPASRRPLMMLLQEVPGGGKLDELNLAVYGYVEGSYTHNMDRPDGGVNGLRAFDFEDDAARLNQVDLVVERPVDATGERFDIGGRMEWIYGADAGLIHSNGLFDYYDSSRDPVNQIDLNQAYLDLALPVGRGLRLRAGKFVTLLGYETISADPAIQPFYTRSYLFGLAIPFTHTGVLGTYALNDQFTVDAGVVRGWEDSVKDKNSAPSYIGRLGWALPDGKTTVFLAGITGPEQPDDSRDFRTVIDLVIGHQVTERLKIGLNGDWGFESNAASNGGDAQWYGTALYAAYRFNDYVTVNTRGEWFDDVDGTRLGMAASAFEATVGLAITPFPGDRIGKNLTLRPELRYDYATKHVFDGGSERDQFTAAIEAIFTF